MSTGSSLVNVNIMQLGGKKDTFQIDLCWTVDVLIEKISVKFDIQKQGMKLLCKGKMLNDKKIVDKTLNSLKIKKNDKIIVMNKPKIKQKDKPKIEQKQAEEKRKTNNYNNKNNVDDAIKRKKNMTEIKAAAEKLAQRHNDGYDWNANYYIELRNQYGDKVVLPDEERQALTIALTLHQKGKQLMKSKHLNDAIEILKLAFESLSKVTTEFIKNIDNYGLLALDIVWCYYLNKDESNLSTASKWLEIAQNGLQCAHGKNMERLKRIRGTTSFLPELALYVRLNLLHALQSFYNNDINGAHSHLLRAEIDLRKLQINDLDLVKLQNMGFHHFEARRGLRFSSGNIQEAINYIYNKRKEIERKKREEAKRANERAQQRKYGHTQNGKFIDLNLLNNLQQIGIIEHELIVEALLQSNNNYQQTIDICLDPQRKEILAQTLFARHLNDKYIHKIEQIMTVLGSNHVSESRVRTALFLSYNDVQEAIRLLTEPKPNDVLDLDRIQPRFVAYVEQRLENMISMHLDDNENINKDEDEKDKDENDKNENDKNENDKNENDKNENDKNENDKNEDILNVNNDMNEIDDIMKVSKDNDDNDDDDDYKMNDTNNNNNNDNNDDNQQIEQHLLHDLDINDEDSYLDIDLSEEQDALNNFKVLLNSIQNYQ